jgi:cyclin D1/2/4
MQVHAYYNFRPLTACLAVNYLDRFLSLYQLPVRIKSYELTK